MEYIIKPFVSVGKIRFDMTRDDIIELFGIKSAQEGKNIFYSNIHIKTSRKGVVNEIIFYEGENELIFEGKNLYKDNNIIKLLSINDEPIKVSGEILFKNSGILFYNFEDEGRKSILILSKNKTISYFKRMNEVLLKDNPFMLLEHYYDNINTYSGYNLKKSILDVAPIIYENGNDEDKEKLRAMIEKMDIKFKELKNQFMANKKTTNEWLEAIKKDHNVLLDVPKELLTRELYTKYLTKQRKSQ